MRLTPAGMMGITVATLAFGLGAAAGSGHSGDRQSSHRLVAEDKGPTVMAR